jgi:hypothetical protein
MTLGKYGMALPSTSTIRIVRISQALIVQNLAEYRRNRLLEVIAPDHQIA